MSYLDYPRIHFSGQFTADPSTINNTPNNYNPVIYPEPTDLDKVELYWCPFGTSSFTFNECVITRVDYSPTSSASTYAEDPIIGQSFSAVNTTGSDMLPGGVIVDLDPAQQNVSEIWGLRVQIGGRTTLIDGEFAPISFNAIWQQGQGPCTPRSSASGSAFYQSQLLNLKVENSINSKFLEMMEGKSSLSINFAVNAHNNSPDTYLFNDSTMLQMSLNGVSVENMKKLEPLKKMAMNRDENGDPTSSSPGGLLPTSKFTEYILKSLLADQYNACQETIFKYATVPYSGSTNCPINHGRVYGTVGTAEETEATYFVVSRMMNPYNRDATATSGAINSPCFFTPFKTLNDGKTVVVNLGNSLPTNTPDIGFYKEKLGKISLVSFKIDATSPDVSLNNATTLVEIDYMNPDFMNNNAGFTVYQSDTDLSTTPLGIISDVDGQKQILLAEDKCGYYLRADQFVYRLNAIEATKPQETGTVNIHALKFGVPTNEDVCMTMKSSYAAKTYTLKTLGESGTIGVENLSIPQDALQITKEPQTGDSAKGVSTFTLTCTDPNNPRGYVNGQIYFLDYGFTNYTAEKDGFVQDANDIVSVQVYDEKAAADPVTTLQKFGRLYKIMGFLTNEEKIEERRNAIKSLLSKPITAGDHMPVTRDISKAELDEVIAYVDRLNA